ncbi:hypothetical protein RAS1_19620 [Phycisphaerae bacterium RAS1]|nr:hypothetical protein RAS1_19620 [Phycisphaerae bacterium RAS1]
MIPARIASCSVALYVCCCIGWADGQEPITTGEKLDPSTFGQGVVETFEQAEARAQVNPVKALNKHDRTGKKGQWVVPSDRATYYPASGDRNVVNKWGDTSMSISFPEPTDFLGANFTGHAGEGVWAPGLQLIGYRNGLPVAESEWLWTLSTKPQWLAANFQNVDRVAVKACVAYDGAGWYGMDDFAFRPHDEEAEELTILDFEDVLPDTNLTASGYAGLFWEEGSGEFDAIGAMPPPQSIDRSHEEPVEDGASAGGVRGGSGTAPVIVRTYRGIFYGEGSSASFPPDTHGAVGTSHFCEVVNTVYRVLNKTTGATVQTINLGTFFGAGVGDPRLCYDHFADRWIIMATDFNTRIYLAVSTTNNPAGAFFKTNYIAPQGTDAGRSPDYPTLGFDQNGIYITAFMTGSGSGCTIWAIDKAPLIAAVPSLGTVTAFRGISSAENAIQPCVTFGTPAGEYFLSRNTGTSVRIRRVNPPLTAPTLAGPFNVTVAGYSDPPDAPAQGSTTPLDSVDARIMNAVYRNNSIWAAHCIASSGRAAARWYEINATTNTVIQQGTVTDAVRHYLFPSIMVNSAGNAVMGFTGTSASQFAGCYYTGRITSDPPGEMATPILFKSGDNQYNLIDSFGRNRWGDYSMTTLDPVDQLTMFTVQEYARSTINTWATWVCGLGPGDCNANGIPDACDISCSNPGCSPPNCGGSLDCNANLIPDQCEDDCNNNDIPDDCDIAAGTPDCNANAIPDSCDIASGVALDCNGNGVPDSCDISSGTSPDCNGNGVPDSCDISAGTSPDCNGNGIPDPCDLASGAAIDCNGNGIPDDCDITSGFSQDCNNNGIPDNPCDLTSIYSSASPNLSPIGAGSPQSYTLIAPPAAVGTVTLDFVARGDFNLTSENVAVDINGTAVGIVFDTPFADCHATGQPDQLTMTASAYNAAVAGGNAVINMIASASVDPNVCNPPSFIRVAVTYEGGTPFSQDANMNGIPDECEGLLGDMNCDGVVDILDINPFTLALSDPVAYAAAFPGCNINNGDINGDGNVDVLDINPFVALLGG